MSKLVTLADNQLMLLDWIAAGTIRGAKLINEDSVTLRKEGSAILVCLADGHWGSGAARLSTAFWANAKSFPQNRRTAMSKTRALEQELFQAYGKTKISEDKDRTPETAFITLELVANSMRFVSYGDCRVVVVRHNRIIIRNCPRPTWLGAFSHLGLRGRIPVGQALEFQQHSLQQGDIVMIFSDGIDECVYGTPTLTDSFFEQAADSGDVLKIHQTIMEAVNSHGAEDNASLVVLRV